MKLAHSSFRDILKSHRSFRSYTNPLIYEFWQSKPKPLQQTVTELQQILSTQTKLQQKTKHDTNKYKQLLQSIGWAITKNDSIITLEKHTQTHKFQAFITAKPPIEIDPEIKESFLKQKEFELGILEEELKNSKDSRVKKEIQSIKEYLYDKPFDQNMAQIAIFVHNVSTNGQKLPTSHQQKPTTSKFISTPQKGKYLCIQYLANSRFATIQSVTLWSRILPSRIQRFYDCTQNTGRGINRMEMEQSLQLTRMVEEDWELRKEVLTTMFELTVCYEQEEYIQWLKNFNQIL